MVALTYHPQPNWPRVHSAKGRLWVDWIDAESEMGWTRQLPQGGWDPAQLEVYSGAEDRDYHVRARIAVQALE